MNDHSIIAAQIEEMHRFIKENEVSFITAVQISNPNRRIVDIGNTWDPMFVVIDYLKS